MFQLFTIGDSVVEVRGRVAWSKRIAFRRHEIGVEFVNVSDELARELTHLATACRNRLSA